MSAQSTRRAERSMAPLWTASARAPEVADEFDKLGLEPTERYFPARAAPLGAASLELVVATFFNFSPRAVSPRSPVRGTRPCQPKSWPDSSQVSIAHCNGPSRRSTPRSCLRRSDCWGLQRKPRAHPEGRPLFAGYASLESPDEPHLALWHAHCLLREFRGDGHIAVLLSEGLTGIEAFAIQVRAAPRDGRVPGFASLD